MLLFATRARPSGYVRVTLPHACRIYSYRRKTPIDHALHMIMLDNGTIGKRAVRFRRQDCQVNTDARRLEKLKSEGLDGNCIMHAYADQQITFARLAG